MTSVTQKFLILGRAKSGTTALAYKIAQALPQTVLIFEPNGRRREKELEGRNIVAKELLSKNWPERIAEYADYDKKVFLIRDPRDKLVSTFLWRLGDGNKNSLGEEEFQKMLALVKDKEKDKNSMSFLELCRLAGVNIYAVKDQMVLECMHGLDAAWHVLKYEDMILGHIDALAGYLGFMPVQEPEIKEEFAKRTVRTKSFGDWRHWLTDADVDELQPLIRETLCDLGYDPEDWQLSDEAPNPEFGSKYLERIYLPTRNKA